MEKGKKDMNSFMIAFGLAGVALCFGTFLRAKVGFLRNMLVPASVIAGIAGMIFMNVMAEAGINIGTDANMYTEIVNHLFTISFISICLTGAGKKQKASDIMKGAWGMGLVWCLLYTLTPAVGIGIIALTGKGVGMDSVYGSLIPFAYCQGPGQAAAYGSLYEAGGVENAAMVAMTFAAVGFIAAFAAGIPAAKLGISRGIAKNCGKIDESILKGYYSPEEQKEITTIRDTTCNSNVETLSYHFALIGLCYIFAIGISKVLGMIPGFFGDSMEGLMFMNGMLAAYIVKFIMKKINVDFLQDDVLQSKITGWTADYLVVCAFMAVGFSVIGEWIVPILIECVVVAAVTFIVCFYFGQRFGGSNDFERTLGLYGASTGTVPSGIALVRIVDAQFRTSTAVELGLMNLVMLLSFPAGLLLLAYAQGELSQGVTVAALCGCTVLYAVLLKVTKTWGAKTYEWNSGKCAVKNGDRVVS